MDTNSKTPIHSGAFIALLFSFVWLFALQFFAGFMIWATILACLMTTGAATAYCFYNYWRISEQGKALISTGISMLDGRIANEKVLLTSGMFFLVRLV